MQLAAIDQARDWRPMLTLQPHQPHQYCETDRHPWRTVSSALRALVERHLVQSASVIE